MELVEGLREWIATFRTGWLAHLNATGETDFKKYVRLRNSEAPSGQGVELGKSHLLFISSAGAYLRNVQDPFDAESPYGDYSIRTFPIFTPFSDLAYAHTHYNHGAVDADPQVLLPLRHLEVMVEEGRIGELAQTVVSFCGYQPDVERVIHETIPPVVDIADREKAHAALLVPAWPLCIQSVGLIARALEMRGVATTLTSWNPGVTRLVNPPRATVSHLNRGATVGEPHDHMQQRRVLEATLALLEQDAPVPIVNLDEQAARTE